MVNGTPYAVKPWDTPRFGLTRKLIAFRTRNFARLRSTLKRYTISPTWTLQGVKRELRWHCDSLTCELFGYRNGCRPTKTIGGNHGKICAIGWSYVGKSVISRICSSWLHRPNSGEKESMRRRIRRSIGSTQFHYWLFWNSTGIVV